MSGAASSSPDVAGSGNTEGQRTLRLGGRSFGPRQRLIMAIVNRTPDSFYDRGATWAEAAAMKRVHEVVGEGADIVDIGGVPAAPGAEVTVTEEIRRTVPFVAAVRAAYPDLVISVDTWRHQTALRAVREACISRICSTTPGAAGDERLPEVAAEYGAEPGVQPRRHWPAAPDPSASRVGIRRRDDRRTRADADPVPTGPLPAAYGSLAESSSTRHTTSGRTPGNVALEGHPAAGRDGGRLRLRPSSWYRCRTRISSARP